MSAWPEREPIFSALSFDELTSVCSAFRFYEDDLMRRMEEIIDPAIADGRGKERISDHPQLSALYTPAVAIQKIAHQAEVERNARFEAEWVDPEEVA